MFTRKFKMLAVWQNSSLLVAAAIKIPFASDSICSNINDKIILKINCIFQLFPEKV